MAGVLMPHRPAASGRSRRRTPLVTSTIAERGGQASARRAPAAAPGVQRPAAAACRRERALQRRHDDGRAVRVEMPEDLGQEPGGVARRMLRGEVIPHRRKRRRRDRGADPGSDLAHRLRLDAPARAGSAGSRSTGRQSAGADARCASPSRPTMVTVVAPTHAIRSSPAHATRHRVPRALDAAPARAATMRHERRGLGDKRHVERPQEALLLGEARADGLRRSPCRRVSSRASSCASSAVLIAVEGRGRSGIGVSACCRMALPRASTPPLSWPSPGPTEARLEEIVRGERRKPRRQRALAADEDPGHRRLEIVVRDARRARRRSAQTRGRGRRES